MHQFLQTEFHATNPKRIQEGIRSGSINEDPDLISRQDLESLESRKIIKSSIRVITCLGQYVLL